MVQLTYHPRTDRYAVIENFQLIHDGLNCGHCMEIKPGFFEPWVSARIEIDENERWYLIDENGKIYYNLEGMEIRGEWITAPPTRDRPSQQKKELIMAAVQIDQELWGSLVLYHLGDLEPAEREELLEDIQVGLRAKIDKIIDREIFSAYKRTPAGPEREDLRKKYLDRRRIHQGFRTAQEESYPEPPTE